VRVNAVTPGLIWTEDAADHYGGEAGAAAVAATVPLGRFGTPRDVADACLYLASRLAAYVSGANLVVAGGGAPPPGGGPPRGGPPVPSMDARPNVPGRMPAEWYTGFESRQGGLRSEERAMSPSRCGESLVTP
jgi:hypothetical protein